MKEVVINGITYKSAIHAARVYKTSPRTIWKYHHTQKPLKWEHVIRYRNGELFYKGKIYTTIQNLQKCARCGKSDIIESYKKNKPLSECRCKKSQRSIKINSTTYANVREAARENKLTQKELKKFIEREMVSVIFLEHPMGQARLSYELKHTIKVNGITLRLRKKASQLSLEKLIDEALAIDWGEYYSESEAQKIIPLKNWKTFRTSHEKQMHTIFNNIYRKELVDSYRAMADYDPFEDGQTTLSARAEYRWTEIGSAFQNMRKNKNRPCHCFTKKGKVFYKNVFCLVLFKRFGEDLKPFAIEKAFCRNRTAIYYPIDIVDGCIEYALQDFETFFKSNVGMGEIIYDSTHPEYLAQAEGLSYMGIYNQ